MRRYRDPQDLDAERAVLGAIITSERALEEALGELTDSDFYSEINRDVFRAVALLAESGPVDHVALAAKLGDDGRKLVFSLVEAVPTLSGMSRWVASLKEHSMRRGVLARAEKVADAAISGDPSDEVEDLNRFATDTQEGEGVVTFATGHAEYVEKVMLRKAGEMARGIPTGLVNLDNATTGFHGGDLVIVAARPSIGKTVYIWQAAVTAARHGKSVFVMNLEMAFERIRERVCCAVGGVSYENWRRGKITAMDAEKLMRASEHLASLPLYIHNPKAGRTVEDFRRAVRALKPDIAFVDYIQLLRTKHREAGEMYSRVSLISNDMKQIALEQQIPLICVSQLSRKVDERYDKRPVLSDLRESGYLEQDADVVLALYRDAFYYPEGVRETAGGEQAVKNFHPQKMEIIARKDREGGNWMVPAFFKGEAMWLQEEPYGREAVA